MCILLCRIKTMNFNLVVFISTAWCLQSFHKSTKIMWSTGGNQEKKSAVKWNWIWVVNSLFSLQHSSKLFLMMNYLAGRKSICGWRSSPCLCLTPVFVCCHQSWDCSSVLEDARELHTQRIHCGSLLSASANFWGAIWGLTLRCVWTRAGNSSATQNQEPGGSCLGLDLPPAPFLSYPSSSEPCTDCCASSCVTF